MLQQKINQALKQYEPKTDYSEILRILIKRIPIQTNLDKEGDYTPSKNSNK